MDGPERPSAFVNRLIYDLVVGALEGPVHSDGIASGGEPAEPSPGADGAAVDDDTRLAVRAAVARQGTHGAAGSELEAAQREGGYVSKSAHVAL